MSAASQKKPSTSEKRSRRISSPRRLPENRSSACLFSLCEGTNRTLSNFLELVQPGRIRTMVPMLERDFEGSRRCHIQCPGNHRGRECCYGDSPIVMVGQQTLRADVR